MQNISIRFRFGAKVVQAKPSYQEINQDPDTQTSSLSSLLLLSFYFPAERSLSEHTASLCISNCRRHQVLYRHMMHFLSRHIRPINSSVVAKLLKKHWLKIHGPCIQQLEVDTAECVARAAFRVCTQMLPAVSLSEIMLRWLHKQIRSEMTLRTKEFQQYSHALKKQTNKRTKKGGIFGLTISFYHDVCKL